MAPTPTQSQQWSDFVLLAALPSAAVLFVGSYWLYRARRTDNTCRIATGAMILACWLWAYLADHTLRAFAVIGSAGLTALACGKLCAMKRHPEVFQAILDEQEARRVRQQSPGRAPEPDGTIWPPPSASPRDAGAEGPARRIGGDDV